MVASMRYAAQSVVNATGRGTQRSSTAAGMTRRSAMKHPSVSKGTGLRIGSSIA